MVTSLKEEVQKLEKAFAGTSQTSKAVTQKLRDNMDRLKDEVQNKLNTAEDGNNGAAGATFTDAEKNQKNAI
ncbi:hypothetical protein JCM3774_002921 [Rhodotorula dairenensis]